jgi:hypothetical protein
LKGLSGGVSRQAAPEELKRKPRLGQGLEEPSLHIALVGGLGQRTLHRLDDHGS